MRYSSRKASLVASVTLGDVSIFQGIYNSIFGYYFRSYRVPESVRFNVNRPVVAAVHPVRNEVGFTMDKKIKVIIKESK